MNTADRDRLTELLAELAAISPLPEDGDDDVTFETMEAFERIVQDLEPIADETAVEPLVRALSVSGDYGLQWMVLELVERQPAEVLRPILTRLLKGGPLGARVWSAAILGRFHDVADLEALRGALSDPSEEVQIKAITAVSAMRHTGVLRALDEMPIRNERVRTARDGARKAMTLTRDELIALVRQIRRNEGEVDELIHLLDQSVPHPAISDLIFWSDQPLTDEEIVDRALNYEPIPLGPSGGGDGTGGSRN